MNTPDFHAAMIEAHDYAVREHARALADLHHDEHEHDEPADAAAEPRPDPNRRARELAQILAHRGPAAAAAYMLADGPVSALRVALALATHGADRAALAALRLAVDAQAPEIEGRLLAAEECQRICAELADALAADEDALQILENAANALAEIGYTVDPPTTIDDDGDEEPQP